MCVCFVKGQSTPQFTYNPNTGQIEALASGVSVPSALSNTKFVYDPATGSFAPAAGGGGGGGGGGGVLSSIASAALNRPSTFSVGNNGQQFHSSFISTGNQLGRSDGAATVAAAASDAEEAAAAAGGDWKWRAPVSDSDEESFESDEDE